MLNDTTIWKGIQLDQLDQLTDLRLFNIISQGYATLDAAGEDFLSDPVLEYLIHRLAARIPIERLPLVLVETGSTLARSAIFSASPIQRDPEAQAAVARLLVTWYPRPLQSRLQELKAQL